MQVNSSSVIVVHLLTLLLGSKLVASRKQTPASARGPLDNTHNSQLTTKTLEPRSKTDSIRDWVMQSGKVGGRGWAFLSSVGS